MLKIESHSNYTNSDYTYKINYFRDKIVIRKKTTKANEKPVQKYWIDLEEEHL